VHLRDIDDLQRMVERNLSGREAEARRAEALLDRELDRFERWLGTLDVVPTIAALHGRGEAVARQVLAENNGRWESLSEADRDRVELIAGTIVRRLLHQPTVRLKASADDDGTYAYVQALRELFGLDTEKLSAFEARHSDTPAGEAANDSDTPAAEVTSIRSRRQHRKR
jgi:glutamyl-tRNA reductase